MADEEPTLSQLVGARLKELRQEAELTQKQIAEALGWKRTVVATIERGRSKEVLMDTLLSYTEVLEVHPAVVFVVIDKRWREMMGWTIEGADLWRIRRHGDEVRVTPKEVPVDILPRPKERGFLTSQPGLPASSPTAQRSVEHHD